MEQERLQKYLASAGVASRRASETLIKEGRVKVNGKVVTELGTKVTPGVDKVLVDNKPVAQEEELVYILMNKPAGYVTTVKDTHERRTVMDLLTGVPYRVFPVGRLDFETEGLLLLTNDGEFAYRMTHPKFKMVKTYVAVVQGNVTEERLAMLRNGVQLEDGMTAPAEVNIVRREKHVTVVEISIYEGRNRQVRRMCEAAGMTVTRLKRIQEGKLSLGDLPLGKWRYLTPAEVAEMK